MKADICEQPQMIHSILILDHLKLALKERLKNSVS